MINNLSSILQIFINFGIGFNLIIAISILVRLRRAEDRKKAYTYSSLLISIDLIFFIEALYFYNININSIIITAILFSIPFAAGPLYYIFYEIITDGNNQWGKDQMRHFIPLPIIFIIIIIVNSFSYVLGYFMNQNFKEISEWYKSIIFPISFLHISLYVIFTLKSLYKQVPNSISNSKGIEKAIWLRIILSCAYLFFFMSISIAYFFSYIFVQCVYVFINLFMVLHFLITQRYPLKIDFYPKNKKFNNEQLTLLEVDDLKNRLRAKMEQDKIYLCENLSLIMLANELEIQPYHLSHILNSYLGTNLNVMINSYRINDAKKMLLELPYKSILSIAFDVGFNSKTSFNRSFRQITGMTPSQYRASSK